VNDLSASSPAFYWARLDGFNDTLPTRRMLEFLQVEAERLFLSEFSQANFFPTTIDKDLQVMYDFARESGTGWSVRLKHINANRLA
jgi:hypothetical protein